MNKMSADSQTDRPIMNIPIVTKSMTSGRWDSESGVVIASRVVAVLVDCPPFEISSSPWVAVSIITRRQLKFKSLGGY